MSFKSRLSACAALIAIAPIAPAVAQDAQPEARTTDVITVTTQFREQSLADVPINVAAFDEEMIEQLDIRNLEDMALFTPGLVIQEQSPNNTGYSLRGITTDSGTATAEARVAMFQDGLSISRSRGSYVELFDIERLEGAKGPQPTLFGRGALIGGIRRIREAGGRITVACSRPNLMRLLHTTGFDRIVPVEETVEAAVTALERDPDS